MPASLHTALTDTSAGSSSQYAVIATSSTSSAFIVRGLPRAGLGSLSLILLPLGIFCLDGVSAIFVPIGNTGRKPENDPNPTRKDTHHDQDHLRCHRSHRDHHQCVCR